MSTTRQKFLYGFLGIWIAGDGLLWIAHQRELALTFLLILVFVGIMELVSKLRTGKTMSQQIAALHRARPWMAVLIDLCLLTGMAALVLHFRC